MRTVVIADAHEWPVRAGVLHIGIARVRAINRAISLERRRHMEVEDLPRVWNLADIEHRAIVAVRNLLRIFDDFVDEVAEVKHEPDLRVRRSALVFPDHPPISVLRAFVDALAGDECKA